MPSRTIPTSAAGRQSAADMIIAVVTQLPPGYRAFVQQAVSGHPACEICSNVEMGDWDSDSWLVAQVYQYRYLLLVTLHVCTGHGKRHVLMSRINCSRIITGALAPIPIPSRSTAH